MPANQDRNPLRLFIRVCRNFGIRTGLRVVYFRVRGILFPGLALPDPTVPNGIPHEVSFLLDASTQNPRVIAAVLEFVEARGAREWEVCISARAPLSPEMAERLAGLRGRNSRVRIIEAQETERASAAAQWTVEQATGRYVALAGSRMVLRPERLIPLITRLDGADGVEAAACFGTGPDAKTDCELLLQRKSHYLAAFDGRWPLLADEAYLILRDRPGALAELRGD
jgi:hypothetical protein